MKNFLILILSALTIYGLFSFLCWEINIANWNWFARFLYLYLTFSIASIVKDNFSK